jgi:4-carboxymuconolactone decarboxylase
MNQELFDVGLQVRREVLGEKYVSASLGKADDFDLPLQEFLTQYCWGEIWTRPGLDRRTRLLLNLAMLTALNRPQELRHYVRAALNNGVTREEIREVFLQAAVYCGMPAAVGSFKVTKEVFDEIDPCIGRKVA